VLLIIATSDKEKKEGLNSGCLFNVKDALKKSRFFLTCALQDELKDNSTKGE